MTNAGSDHEFVEEMLRQAQHVLGNDPRIHFTHVRHAGAQPTESSRENPPRQTEGVRSAWSQTLALATLLGDLWEHAWLPNLPTDADVHFADTDQGIRIEVTGRGASFDRAIIGTAHDRLMVRGYISESSTEDGFTATSGSNAITVGMTASETSMALSAALDSTDITLDMLSALPRRVPTRPEENAE